MSLVAIHCESCRVRVGYAIRPPAGCVCDVCYRIQHATGDCVCPRCAKPAILTRNAFGIPLVSCVCVEKGHLVALKVN